jgi:glycosyltransferase involved in cell wall biosynthesis
MTAPCAVPMVSVYLPTRNRAHLVGRAIASVLVQDFRDFELLVVDDASTDATPEVLAGIAEHDPRVRLHRLDQHGGAPAARNLALRAAVGRYATGIDDDDEMLPNRLSSLLHAWDERYAFVCSGALLNAGEWCRPARTSRMVITLADELYGDQAGTQILTLTARMREVGLFDESLPAWQDYDLWTRLIERHGPALRIAEPSYLQRVEPGTTRISERGAEGAQRYIDKHRHRMSDDQLVRQQLERYMLQRDRMTLAAAASFLTRRTYPVVGRYWLTSNLPVLRRLAERFRRWRWSPTRQPNGIPRQV